MLQLKCYCVFVPLTLVFDLMEASVRTNVKIVGSTSAPNLSRPHGKRIIVLCQVGTVRS